MRRGVRERLRKRGGPSSLTSERVASELAPPARFGRSFSSDAPSLRSTRAWRAEARNLIRPATVMEVEYIPSPGATRAEKRAAIAKLHEHGVVVSVRE